MPGLLDLRISLTQQSSEKAMTTLQGQLKDLAPVMPRIANVLLSTVQASFRGGRLMRRGALLRSLTKDVTPTSAFVRSNLPYSRVQQFGSNTRIPAIVARPGRVLHFRTKDGTDVFTRSIQAHTVKIPGQRYMPMPLPDAPYQAIVRLLEAHILRGQA